MGSHPLAVLTAAGPKAFPPDINIRLAEREGFEPPVSCPTPDFESGAFDQLGHLSASKETGTLPPAHCTTPELSEEILQQAGRLISPDTCRNRCLVIESMILQDVVF